MNILFIADPLEQLDPEDDSTMGMMVSAAARGYSLWHAHINDLLVADAEPMAHVSPIKTRQGKTPWFQKGARITRPLRDFKVIMMRKDPPFTLDYIYATYILELAESQGSLVVNRAQSLRDANEKMFIHLFPRCITDTLVSSQIADLKAFQHRIGDVIIKPLDGKGGSAVFRLRAGDPNTNVVLEQMTQHHQRLVMAQRYLPEIEKKGDHRIFLINGEPIPFVWARFAPAGETRASLYAGGRAKAMPISKRERWLCKQIASLLRAKGLYFVGLDVIGDYITEINVTSPGGMVELSRACGLDIAGQLWEQLVALIA